MAQIQLFQNVGIKQANIKKFFNIIEKLIKSTNRNKNIKFKETSYDFCMSMI